MEQWGLSSAVWPDHRAQKGEIQGVRMIILYREDVELVCLKVEIVCWLQQQMTCY